MALSPGARLGPYEILALIGAGGMGEVYKAHDPRMGRDVAIKVSAEQFSERFDREVRAVAALNHPNICQIYDVGPNYLVMEFVDGESPQGPYPLEEALRYARQIVEALNEAHEKGIIHRDLKPANIKIRPDGTLKVLDFGLAKVAEPEASSRSENSPTLTLGATQAGSILGTAAYMPPEQARGKKVDKRADIWAFGVVLFEMLTGRRLFDGETISDTLIEVATKEPDWEQAPVEVRRLLRRCLEKDPKKRLRDIGDVWELVGQVSDLPVPKPQAGGLRYIAAWAVAAVAVVGASWALLRQPATDTHSLRYTIDAPPNARFTNAFFGTSVSPDGRLLTFTALRSSSGSPSIWLRPMDSVAARELAGTDGGNGMFWRPDSKSLGFATAGKLKRVDVLGGLPQDLCDAPNFQGGTWGPDGTILFSANNVIERVSAAGGAPTAVTTLDAARAEASHRDPYLLPDGKTFLFTILSPNQNTQGVYVASLDAPRQRVRLAASSAKAVYAPARNGWPGYLLWVRDQTLVAQRFDGKTRLEGDPVPVADQVGQNELFRAAFWSSDSGLLLYRTGGSNAYQLHWVGRDGKREVIAPAGASNLRGSPRLSPDGSRVAFDQPGNAGAGVAVSASPSATSDIWLYEFARGGVMTRLTTGPGNNTTPVWSPDGSQVAFRSDRRGTAQVYRKGSTGIGQDERLTEGPNPKTPLDWSPDGRYLLYEEQDPKTGFDIWALPLEGDRKPIPVLRSQFDERMAQFSPDSKWIAYASNESATYQIYIQSFPPSSVKRTVSNTGGFQPRWRGKELYYYVGTGTGYIWAAGVRTTAGRLEIDPPRQLMVPYTRFSNPIHYDVTRDGQRILEIQPPGEGEDASSNALTVISNWQAGLKQ